MLELTIDRPTAVEVAGAAEAALPLRGWRVELIQLGRRKFRTMGTLWPAAGVEFVGLHMGCTALLRGVSPPGRTALVVVHPSSPPFRLASRPLQNGACLMLGSMAAIDLYMPENSRGCIVSIACDVSGPIDSGPPRGAAEFRSLKREHRSLLLGILGATTPCGASPPGPVFLSMQTPFSEHLVPEAAQMIPQSTLLPTDRDGKAIRRMAVKRACGYIDAHLRERITLPDLCAATGACSRTLEYGFREFYDVGPMTFLKALRLSRVRRDLSFATSSGGSVTASARRWRFSHMGQFSRDYRLLFGESPSATLARACGQVMRANPRV